MIAVIGWTLMLAIDFVLLSLLAVSPFVSATLKRKRAEVEMLREAFEVKVPSGWIFYGGDGV